MAQIFASRSRKTETCQVLANPETTEPLSGGCERKISKQAAAYSVRGRRHRVAESDWPSDCEKRGALLGLPPRASEGCCASRNSYRGSYDWLRSLLFRESLSRSPSPLAENSDPLRSSDERCGRNHNHIDHACATPDRRNAWDDLVLGKRFELALRPNCGHGGVALQRDLEPRGKVFFAESHRIPENAIESPGAALCSCPLPVKHRQIAADRRAGVPTPFAVAPAPGGSWAQICRVRALRELGRAHDATQ